MSQNFGDTNFIYLYDLPKEDISSTKLAQAFEEQAKVTLLDGKPQIRRDLTRPFYSGIVQIKDAQKFQEASEKMRYFQINDKWCRALKFDKQLLGSNKEKLLNNNVFVRKVPSTCFHSDLHTKFEKYGVIKSLKVSLNSDHSSRGYGFICFQDEQSANNAVQGTMNDEDTIAMKFEAKGERKNIFNLINNVYVKNIPLSMTDEQVREMFEPYGKIQSLVVRKDEAVKNYQFGFVCYNDEALQDKEYGPKCAQAAISGLHNREMGEGLKLYVRAAMKKSDRDTEKIRETLRYKSSKKRCNLYVKNFPMEWEEQNLIELFEKFGPVEKIKLEKKGKGNAAYAFVCFKTPDAAASAKQTLHNQTFEGKTLMINHYEIKELRELQREEAMDKSNFEQYMAQKTGGFHLNDLITHPHMTQILQQLLEIMQQNEAMNNHFSHQERNMQNRQRPPQNRNYNQRPQHYGGQNMHGGGQNQQHMGGQHGGMPQQPGMHNQQRMNQPAPPMAQPPMPAQPGMPGLPQGGMQMPGVPGQMNTAQMTPDQKYINSTQKLLPSVSEKNPYLKDQVGQAIFEYVNMLVPPERAPKITGMLIELPVDQIKGYMMSFPALRAKVQEATLLIDNAEKQGINTQQQ